MKLFTSKRYQRVTNLSLAALLLVSTITASVPFIFSQKADAASGYNVNVSQECVNGLVRLNITGDNPNASNVWVKSSANFKYSAPANAGPLAQNVPVPIQFDQASIPDGGVTIYYSDSENGNYQLLTGENASASYAAFNCYDTVYVAPAGTGSDANSGTDTNSPFATIQKAVNTVNSGGTVVVAAGAYSEAVSVTKPVTINGAQATVDARTRSSAESVVNAVGTAPNFNVQSSNVVIDGFTFNSPAGNSSAVNVYGPYSNTTIKNNIFNVSGRGVLFNTSNMTLSRNVVNNTAASFIAGFEQNSSASNNVVIDSNTFNGGTGADINFIGNPSTTSTGLVVKNNKSVDGSSFLGLTNTTNALVEQNTVTGNPRLALFIAGNNHGTRINGNTIATTNATGAGIIVTNVGYGLNTDIKGTKNSFAGSVNGVVVDNGTLVPNGSGLAAGQTADFSANWWGAPTGPQDPIATDGSNLASNNGAGAGAHGAVTYASWYTNAGMSELSNATLAAPTNLTPADGSYTRDPNFAMTWSTVSGAVAYQYKASYTKTDSNTLGTTIYTDSSDTSSNYSSTATTVTRTNSGTPDGTYYWQVRAKNAEGAWGAWSAVSGVTVDKTAPAAPVVTAEGIASGNSTSAESVTILWNKPSADTATYDYRVWTNAKGSAYNSVESAYYANDLTGNSRNGAFTEGEGTYFVQVRATDIAGNESGWSNTFEVTYDKTNPEISGEGYTQNGNVFTPQFTTDEDLTYQWTAGETNTAPASFENDVLNPDFTVTETGNYRFTLIASDAAGNQVSRTISFTYTKPAIEQPIGDNSGTTNNSTGTSNGGTDQAQGAFSNVAVTPAITNPGSAVLGATTDNANANGSTDVKGATDDKTASAVNSDVNKGNIFGLAWYWWILILAALAAIAWFIIAAIRRRNEEEA